MDEGKNDSQMTSAAAFVEGGIQEACDDSCSICLEAFCNSDPCTVTSCKHEFHLQCILEWCQRSSNCPMCWQSISMKDPASQELLEAVEQERNFRFNMARNSTVFHHPTLGDFELQHLPVGVNDAELEDRIIHHLAAAAAMRRTHHVGGREGSRSWSANARPQLLVFSTNPNVSPVGTISPSAPVGEEAQSATITGPAVVPTRPGTSVVNRSLSGQSSLPNQDRAGPSDFHSFSDSWKSRLNAISVRYKESISKSTRGWKEKLFSRSTSMADIGSEVRREVNVGIANVSRMMENLEARESNRHGRVSTATNVGDTSAPPESNHENKMNNNTASVAASSASK